MEVWLKNWLQTHSSGFHFADRRRFQDYISPGDEIEGLTSTSIRSRSQTQDDASSDPEDGDPLPDDVLTVNFGLDLVVVITKTDYMVNLEKELDYKEEHFDFIQQAIRKLCLKCKFKVLKHCLFVFTFSLD